MSDKIIVIVAIGIILIMLAVGIAITDDDPKQDCSDIMGYDVDNPKNSTGLAEECLNSVTPSQLHYPVMIMLIFLIPIGLITILIIRLLG